MTDTLDIPIFPLGTVLFPGSVLPLRIFEQRYVDMTKACIGNDSPFGVCLILDGREAGEPAVPHAVGCTARITEWEVPTPGLFTLRTTGERRFRIQERYVQRDGLIRARVTLHAPMASAPVDDEHGGLTQLYERIVERFGDKLFPSPPQPEDGTWLTYRLADLLDLPMAAKQRLLETEAPRSMQALLWNLLRAQAEPGGSA